MCEFVSAIVKPNGDLVCRPEASDSHTDLLAHAGIVDRTCDTACCVEFFPDDKTDIFEPAKYVLRVDQGRRPSWYSEEMEARTRESLRDRVRRMVITEDREIILGGCWLVAPGVTIERAVGCRIPVCAGKLLSVSNTGIGKMWDSSQVQEMLGSSQVQEMLGSSQVHRMRGSSQVHKMLGSFAAPREQGNNA